MDPLTQGLLGAAAAQAALGHRLGRVAGLVGFAAGVLADADVFLLNPGDPTFGFVYHRHFTHSLFFIPIGAVLASAVFLAFRRWRPLWREVLLAALVAYATHGLLDAATSYGTLLLWPFSNARIAWDVLPIIDFFVTPVLLVGVIVAGWGRFAWPARMALGLLACYVLLGAVQNQRALAAQQALADSRGHRIERGRAMPAPGTLVLWRSLYEHEGVLYADAVRTPLLGRTRVREGSSVPLARPEEFVSRVNDAEEGVRVFRVFAWFSDQYVVADLEQPSVLVDARYSSSLGGFEPLWGIQFEGDRPSNWWGGRRGGYASDLWALLTRGDDSFVPLASLGMPAAVSPAP